ncbi:MAG: hypothetical protein MMC33_008796 [Icmadophila ericetorum]|nr:hypothetical protein [Icmadophila ericetorum]
MARLDDLSTQTDHLKEQSTPMREASIENENHGCRSFLASDDRNSSTASLRRVVGEANLRDPTPDKIKVWKDDIRRTGPHTCTEELPVWIRGKFNDICDRLSALERRASHGDCLNKVLDEAERRPLNTAPLKQNPQQLCYNQNSNSQVSRPIGTSSFEDPLGEGQKTARRSKKPAKPFAESL